MKRSALKRGKPLRRVAFRKKDAEDFWSGKSLAAIGYERAQDFIRQFIRKDQKPRMPLRKVGKRGRRARQQIEAARPIVKARAGNRCERCNGTRRLQLHHKVRRSRAPGWDGLHHPDNLELLCGGCHAAEHFG